MNIIGIIGAMEEEVAQLKEIAEIEAIDNALGLEFYKGKVYNKNVVFVKSGIGKVNAALCAQVLISKFNVDCVINVGVGGAVSKELNIGDVVISTDTVQHDMDTSALGDKIGDIPRMEESYFKANETLINAAYEAGCALEGHNVFKGRVASGDKFIAKKEDKEFLETYFNAYCAEMEGAAIGHACYLNKVPFVVIRSISDKADGGAEMDYMEFLPIAANNSFKILQFLINKLD